MAKRIRLSSIITFPYKYIVPLMPLGLAILFNLTIDKEPCKGCFFPVYLVFLIMFLLAFFQLKNLKKVEYSKENLIVSNYFKSEVFKLVSVVGIKRWLFYFYKISIDTNEGIKKILFMPHMQERLLRPYGKLDSIIKFERKIK